MVPLMYIKVIQVQVPRRAAISIDFENLNKLFEYSHLRFKYSDDPTMLQGVKIVTILADSFKLNPGQPIPIDELDNGKRYYFLVSAGLDDIFSTYSQPMHVLVGTKYLI